MIDFRLTETDQAHLARTFAEGEIIRRYAREVDENEAEMPPDVLPEADEFYANAPALPDVGPEDTQGPVMMLLQIMAGNWGDYSGPLAPSRKRWPRQRGALRRRHRRAEGRSGAACSCRWRSRSRVADPIPRVSTTAVLDEETNEWVLNGEKIFVTTGIRADGVVMWATIDKSAGRAGIKSFLVEKGTPRASRSPLEKLGIRADDTAAYVFKDCRIPRENLLGLDETIPRPSSGGFRGVMKTFNMTRPATAAMGLGCAWAAIDLTREALEEAGVVLDYGGARWARSSLRRGREVHAARGALRSVEARHASVRLDGRQGAAHQHGVVDLQGAHAGGAVRQITQGCIEILGSIGASRELLLEKWMRDSRITDIYEGTGEIQRLIIARGLLDYTREDLK